MFILPHNATIDLVFFVLGWATLYPMQLANVTEQNRAETRNAIYHVRHCKILGIEFVLLLESFLTPLPIDLLFETWVLRDLRNSRLGLCAEKARPTARYACLHYNIIRKLILIFPEHIANSSLLAYLSSPAVQASQWLENISASTFGFATCIV